MRALVMPNIAAVVVLPSPGAEEVIITTLGGWSMFE